MPLTFDDFEIDPDRYELRRGGVRVPLERRVFDLLVHLATHPGQVFSRDQLIEAVWSGRVVADSTIAGAVKSVRKALGDSGEHQRYIRTVHGRGFGFIAPHVGASTTVPADDVSARRRDRGRPTLAVSSFTTRHDAGTPAHVLGTTLSTELQTLLTRIPLLRILPARSSPDGPEQSIAAPGDADYVLEGHVRTTGSCMRVNIVLGDAPGGHRLWAERFQAEGGASAADVLVVAIIAKLEPQLNRAIYESVRSTEGAPNARELYLQASTLLALRSWHGETFTAAADMLRRCCSLEPDFALAFAYLALVLALGHRFGLLKERDTVKSEGIAAAERALQLDNMDSTVLGFAGCALADLGMIPRALPILRNATQRNPANAQAWAALGSACLMSRRPEQAVEYLRHGIGIAPLDSRLSVWGAVLALAYLQVDDIANATAAAESACQQDDRAYLPRVVLAACHAVAGDAHAMCEARKDAYRVKPDLSDDEIVGAIGRRLHALAFDGRISR